MSGDVGLVATLLLTGATRYRLYGAEHRLTREALDELLAALEPLLAEQRQMRLAITGDEVITEAGRVDATDGSAAALVRRLSEKGIGLLELHRGVKREELATFCAQLADPKPGAVSSQPHLLVGAAELKVGRNAMAEALRVRVPAGWRDDPISEEAQQTRHLLDHLREHQEVRLRDAREIVLGLLSHVSCQENVFFNLAEVREHNLFTYLHTCNVATLGMSFALAIGTSPEDTFELGGAALLHDIGKTFVPRAVLDKPGKLDDDEWQMVRQHPAIGAQLLLQQPDASHLSVVVAYEHHMHYAGGGGYPSARFGPSIQSQLVAIADTFDALFGKRSYHAPYEVLQALEVLQGERGRMYNPDLVDEFSRFVTQQLDELGPTAA